MAAHFTCMLILCGFDRTVILELSALVYISDWEGVVGHVLWWCIRLSRWPFFFTHFRPSLLHSPIFCLDTNFIIPWSISPISPFGLAFDLFQGSIALYSLSHCFKSIFYFYMDIIASLSNIHCKSNISGLYTNLKIRFQ